MDIVTDPAFWGEVSLTAASRLAVLAAVLWIARLALRHAIPMAAPRTKAAMAAPTRNRLETRRTQSPEPRARFLNLRNGQEAGRPKAAADSEARNRDNPLRNRLMEYLEPRATERTKP
jgi:hypothetical protein